MGRGGAAAALCPGCGALSAPAVRPRLRDGSFPGTSHLGAPLRVVLFYPGRPGCLSCGVPAGQGAAGPADLPDPALGRAGFLTVEGRQERLQYSSSGFNFSAARCSPIFIPRQERDLDPPVSEG